jgi:hypothetical protein
MAGVHRAPVGSWWLIGNTFTQGRLWGGGAGLLEAGSVVEGNCSLSGVVKLLDLLTHFRGIRKTT